MSEGARLDLGPTAAESGVVAVDGGERTLEQDELCSGTLVLIWVGTCRGGSTSASTLCFLAGEGFAGGEAARL